MNDPTSQVPFPDSYWVLPGRLLAGEHPGDLDPGILVTRLTALLDAGIRTFVDLTDEHELEPYYAPLRTLAGERALGITYACIPIRDMGVPSACTLKCILDILDRSLANDQAAYVHCFAGRGRTGTVIGAYLKCHRLATAEDVLAKIAHLRRHMPTSQTLSPQTQEQIKMVKEWAEGE